MYKKFYKILLILIVFIINGCVSTHFLKPNKEIKENNGVAVIALVNDKSEVTALNGGVTFHKIGSKDNHYINAENDYNPFDNDFKFIKNVRGRVLAIELPAGNYALTNWSMANYATSSYILPKKAEPIYFTVKPHTVTYLGHFLFKTKYEGKDLFNRPVASGGEVVITNQANIDMTIAKRKYPNIKALPVSTQVKPISSWKQNYLND